MALRDAGDPLPGAAVISSPWTGLTLTGESVHTRAAADVMLTMLIQAGDAEILRDDSTRFAAAARAAGVDVTLEIWDEMPHVWHAFAGLLPEADMAVEHGPSPAGA